MVLLFPVLLTVHPLSNFLLSSNAFPPTMTFGDFFLTKSLVISLHHPFIYPALQQIFSGRIFVYWTGWESKVSKKQFPSSSSFSVDALDLALAANECACQIMNWIHHLSITFWKSLSLVGCAIALVWIGREGWEPFVFSSDAPSENAWPADWEPYIHHLLPWPEWERWEGISHLFWSGQAITCVPLLDAGLLWGATWRASCLLQEDIATPWASLLWSC